MANFGFLINLQRKQVFAGFSCREIGKYLLFETGSRI